MITTVLDYLKVYDKLKLNYNQFNLHFTNLLFEEDMLDFIIW